MLLFLVAGSEETANRIMVLGGFVTTENSSMVEFLDIANEGNAKCQDFPRLPDNTMLDYVAAFIEDRVVMCHYFACYSIAGKRSGEWTRTSVKSAQFHSPTGLVLADGRWWITGGDDKEGRDPTDKTWVYADGEFEDIITLPWKTRDHCMTKLPDGRVFIAGGTFSAAGLSDKGAAYFYYPREDIWEKLPTPWSIDPKDDDPEFACGVSSGEEIVVLTTGTTYTDQDQSYVQVYNVASKQWRAGPELDVVSD